jgi:multicomponent Na+:H+ antiporter subunit E
MARKRTPSVVVARLAWGGQTALALFLVWLALDGPGNLWLGALFSCLAAAVGVWLAPGEVYPWRPLRLLLFILFFLRESFRGGVDVAWRAMLPGMPIEPTFVEFPLNLPPGLPRTVMVGVISLLPGTLSVDLDQTTLRVHALTPAAADNLPQLQRRIRHLFSLETDSGADEETP